MRRKSCRVMIILHSLNLSFKVTPFVDSVAPPTCVTVAGPFAPNPGGSTTTYPKDFLFSFNFCPFLTSFLRFFYGQFFFGHFCSYQPVASWLGAGSTAVKRTKSATKVILPPILRQQDIQEIKLDSTESICNWLFVTIFEPSLKIPSRKPNLRFHDEIPIIIPRRDKQQTFGFNPENVSIFPITTPPTQLSLWRTIVYLNKNCWFYCL